MSHDTWVALHVLGVVVFLGNLVVTAVWKTLADRTRDASVVAYAQRLVTVNLSVFRRHPCGAAALGSACKSG